MDLKVCGNKAALQTCNEVTAQTARCDYSNRSQRGQHDTRVRSHSARKTYSRQKDRPQCVPVLDLDYLQEPATKSKNLIYCYDLTQDNEGPKSHGSCSFRETAEPVKLKSTRHSHRLDVPILDIAESNRTQKPNREKTSVWDSAVIPEDLPKPSEKYTKLYSEYQQDRKTSYSRRAASLAAANTVRGGSSGSPDNTRQSPKAKTEGTKENSQKMGNTNENAWKIPEAEDTKERVPQLEDSRDKDGIQGVEDSKEVEDAQLEQYMSRFLLPSNSLKHSPMENGEESRKKEQMVETVMVDQLSRSVICDPEQDTHLSEPHRYISHKPRGVNRFLHETSIKTQKSYTEKVLSKRVRFGVRILTQCGHDALRELMGFFFYVDNSLTIYEFRQFSKSAKALPFIVRATYPSHVSATQPYTLRSIYQGSNLEISSNNQPCLPESLKRKPTVLFRVTDVDEEEKSSILLSDVLPSQQKEVYIKMHLPRNNCTRKKFLLFAQIQKSVRCKLRENGAWTVAGLGQYYRTLCRRSGVTQQNHLKKQDLEEGLRKFHISLSPKSLNAVFDYLDPEGKGHVEPTVYMRAVLGEMNEQRKSCVRKAFRRLRGAHHEDVSVGVLEKFHKTGRQDSAASGTDALQLLLDVFGKSSKRTELISYAEWEQYYEGVSLGIESDVDFFETLKKTWSM